MSTSPTLLVEYGTPLHFFTLAPPGEYDGSVCAAASMRAVAINTVANSRFYRAMLCIRGTSHGPVSVRLSVTSRSSTETDERIELFFLHVSFLPPAQSVINWAVVGQLNR